MKKPLLFIIIVLSFICAAIFLKTDSDSTTWFYDNDLIYQNVSISMSYEELKNSCPLPRNERTIDADSATIYFDDFNVYIYKDTVSFISITNTLSEPGIFNIKIGDSLEEIKSKLPYELIERNDYGNLIKNVTRKNYGELLNFYDNDRYLGSTIAIYSSSGKTIILIDLDLNNLTAESINYQLTI